MLLAPLRLYTCCFFVLARFLLLLLFDVACFSTGLVQFVSSLL